MSARTVTVTFCNMTLSTLYKLNSSLYSGEWEAPPSDKITSPYFVPSGSPWIWKSVSAGVATGTDGAAIYQIDDGPGRLLMFWDNPFVGSNSYSAQIIGCAGFNLKYSGGGGDDALVTFTLTHTDYDEQQHWRWCHKCQGLFFGDNPGSHCPAGGGHGNVGSGNYHLATDPAAPGQQHWYWCHKCQGLFFGDHPNSVCPAGGTHENKGSGNYRLLDNAQPNEPSQGKWHWCYKCQGLFYSGNPGSHCPAGSAHASVGSGDYRLVHWNIPG
jgi:hypothetical protein